MTKPNGKLLAYIRFEGWTYTSIMFRYANLCDVPREFYRRKGIKNNWQRLTMNIINGAKLKWMYPGTRMYLPS